MSAKPEEAAAAAAAEAPKGQAPGKNDLEQSVKAAQKVVEYQSMAEELKTRAMKAVSPAERMKLYQDAYDKEVAAHGESKKAKRLASGTWQGAAGGAGIGGGVGMGLGAVVGTLVGGLLSLPTVGIGGLIGAGVGGIKGPFIKLGGGRAEEGKSKMSEAELRAYAQKQAEALDQAVEKSSAEPQPPKHDDADGDAGAADGGSQTAASAETASTGTPRKKPRKLQVRSGNVVKAAPPRKKPRKLEVRSGVDKKANV